jgi:branched-chain amino acid transport system ATP-binding protein
VTEPLLEVADLRLQFKGVTAIDDVSFGVAEGELFAIIGPNGAGKTSVFNCVSGVYLPTAGSIRFDGDEIVGERPHKIAASGLVRTFQNVEVFPTMTVVDNLLLGRYHHMKTGLISGALWAGRAVREEVAQRAKVEEIIDFLEIQTIRNALVGNLPHGLQKRVELGRALAMEPRLLMLDEPVAGMNQEETEDMVRFILDVNEELGVTIILVEHDMGVVMSVSSRVLVLDFGRVVSVGSPAEVAVDPAVIEAYLGAQAVEDAEASGAI